MECLNVIVRRVLEGPLGFWRVLEGPEGLERSWRVLEGLEGLGGSWRVWEGPGWSWRVQ